MHLIEIVDYNIVPTEEAMLVKPIRDIWNKDKTVNKEKALRVFTMIYHMYDPRSSYSYITDDNDRFNAILEEENIEEFDMKPYKTAIEAYKSHVITTSYLLLQDVKLSVDKVRDALKSIDFSSLDEKDKVTAIKNVVSMTSLIPKLIKELNETENVITKEIDEKTRARGGSETNSLFEDM